MITHGTCIVCNSEFTYVRYRADRNYCSDKCRGRHYYVTKGSYSQRSRRTKMSAAEWKDHKREYDRQRLQNPEIRAAHNERNRRRYATDEYRALSRARYYANGDRYNAAIPLQHGYTGHRWFDLVREYVGNPPMEGSVYFDRWADRMGVAVLALLEGRDIKEALKEHNSAEYIPQHRTIRLGDWGNDPNEQDKIFDALFGAEESAEEVAVAKETIAYQVASRYSHGSNRRRFGKAGSHRGRVAPSRREGYRPYQDRPRSRRA